MVESLKPLPEISFDFGNTGTFTDADKDYAILKEFSLRLGVEPNTASVDFVGEVPEGFFRTGGNYPVSIKINGTTHKFITVVTSSNWQNTRTKTITLVQPGRGMTFKSRKVTRFYNQAPKTDFDPAIQSGEEDPGYGYWWRPNKGNGSAPEFVEFEGMQTFIENYSTWGINAWQAIYDIDNQFDDDGILILPKATELLQEYILPPTEFSQMSEIDAINNILSMVGSFWIYEVTDEDGYQKLLIGAKGSDTDNIDVIYGETGDNLRTLFGQNEDDVLTPGLKPAGEPKDEPYDFICLRNNIQLQNKAINAVHAIGANRRYFIKDAILFPAWDYWNDYLFVCRDSRSMQIVDPDQVPKLSFVKNTINRRIWSAIKPYGTGLATTSLPVMAAIISALNDGMESVALFYKEQYNATDYGGYLINPCTIDMAMFGSEDPYHQYRLKRFVALDYTYEWTPDDIEDIYLSQVPRLRRKGYGWAIGQGERYYTPSYKDLVYLKNIHSTVVDGRLTRIEQSALTDGSQTRNVSGAESLQYSVPLVAEFFYPIQGAMDTNSSRYNPPKIQNTWDFDWWIAQSRVDGENGFIYVDPQYALMPQGTVTSSADLLDKNVWSIPVTTKTQDGYYPKAHNVVWTSLNMKFGSSGRATLVYNEQEDHAINERWDEVEDGFEQNVVSMAAVVNVQDAQDRYMLPAYMEKYITDSDGSNPDTRVYGDAYTDRDMIWVTDVRNRKATDAEVEYVDPNWSTGFITDDNVSTVYHVKHVISFVLRDDREMLVRKAIGNLLRQTGDTFSGDMDVLAPYGMGQGYGLGVVRNLKIGEHELNDLINIKEMSFALGPFTWSLRFEASPSFFPQIHVYLRPTMIEQKKVIHSIHGERRMDKMRRPFENRSVLQNSLVKQLSNFVSIPITNAYQGSLNYDANTGALIRQAAPPARLPEIGYASVALMDGASAYTILADTERNIITFEEGTPTTSVGNVGFIGVSNSIDIEGT